MSPEVEALRERPALHHHALPQRWNYYLMFTIDHNIIAIIYIGFGWGGRAHEV